MLVTIVAGARPNFMKVAPIIKALRMAKENGHDVEYRLIHTGQHYDKKMSGDFFEQLQLPQPDANLGAGGGSQADQTASIMTGFEKELQANRPDHVLVVGDVTSTMACAITAKKMHIQVCHVEAGIRSGDRKMPEEINRLVTDAITDLFFTTSETASHQLRAEGHQPQQIHFVGNTMIDTLMENLPRIRRPQVFDQNGINAKNYLVLTLHRPSNVDQEEVLIDLLQNILAAAGNIPVVFPVHPRTAKVLERAGFDHDRMITTDPMGYLEFIYAIKNCKGVITDSGGITEETTVLGIPCMTLRDSTERPETVTVGTNELIGSNPADVGIWVEKMIAGSWKTGGLPALWDGKTGTRIVEVLLNG